MSEIKLAYRQNNESIARDFGELREAMPEPSLRWLRFVKLPYLVLVGVLLVPLGGYVGSLVGDNALGAVFWGGTFWLGWRLWDATVMGWARRVTLRELARYRPERNIELTVSDAGLQFTDEVSATMLKWEGVQAIVPVTHGIGVIFDMTTYYIPAGAFSTDDARLAFVAEATAKLSGRFQKYR